MGHISPHHRLRLSSSEARSRTNVFNISGTASNRASATGSGLPNPQVSSSAVAGISDGLVNRQVIDFYLGLHMNLHTFVTTDRVEGE